MTTQETTRPVDGLIPEKAIGGLVLVGIGLAVIASYLIDGFGEYLLLAIGLICLAAFVFTREYGYAVATGITGGLGVGVVLTTMFSDPYDGVVFMLAFAGGFLVVWLLGLLADPRETHPWPLIPAVLFAAVAVTIVTETSVLLDALVVLAIIALIGGGLKAIRDARKEA
jgi:hypothetical protein